MHVFTCTGTPFKRFVRVGSGKSSDIPLWLDKMEQGLFEKLNVTVY